MILNTFASENSLSWPLFFVILPKTWPAQREVGSKWPLDIKYLLEVRVAEGSRRLMQLGGVNFVGLDNAVGQLLTRPHVCITHFPVTESTPIHVKLAFLSHDCPEGQTDAGEGLCKGTNLQQRETGEWGTVPNHNEKTGKVEEARGAA